MKNMEEIGECDCKFPRWVDYIASLHPTKAVDVVVESTDSDYIMIGMLHYEQQVLFPYQNSLGRVFLHRMFTTAAGDKKRKANDGEPAAQKPAKRQYEYVNIPLLYEIMSNIGSRVFGGAYPIRSFALAVALGGTDFSRSTPQVSLTKFL